MGKHHYRATELSQVSVPRLLAEVGEGRVVIGVDVAKETFFGCVLSENRCQRLVIRWVAPLETRSFVDFVVSLGVRRVEVVMEPSGTYGDPLGYQLRRAGVAVYLVSAKRTHDLAEAHDGVPSSHDAKAAEIIAKLHLDGGSRRWLDASEEERTLSTQVDLMHVFDRQAEDNQNRLEAKLARHWPEGPQILSLGGITMLTLLQTFGNPQAIAAQEPKARELMHKTGRTFLSSDKIELLLASARSTTGIPMNPAETASVQVLAGEVLRNRRKADELGEQAKKASEHVGSVQGLSKVVGSLTAVALTAFLGDFSTYESANSLVKAAGLNLKEHSSGKHHSRLKITKRGSSKARWYLYLATLRMLQKDPVFLAWHKKKVQRDGYRTKLPSVVALMRKLLKGLWHVARGREFDSTQLFDTRKLDVQPIKARAPRFKAGLCAAPLAESSSAIACHPKASGMSTKAGVITSQP